MLSTRYRDLTIGGRFDLQRESELLQLAVMLTKTDRNGIAHTFAYETLGREISDTVSTLACGVDVSVRRIETAYCSQANPYLIRSYDATKGGSVANQIERA